MFLKTFSLLFGKRQCLSGLNPHVSCAALSQPIWQNHSWKCSCILSKLQWVHSSVAKKYDAFLQPKKNALGLSSLDQSHHLLFLLLLFFFLSFFPFFLHIISKGHPNTYHVLYTKVLHVLYVWLVFAFGKIHTHSSSLNQHKGLSEIHRAWSDSSRCKVCSFSFWHSAGECHGAGSNIHTHAHTGWQRHALTFSH